VQAAREASRRSQCTNHLKQIGVAVHNYANVHKILPPGAFWSCPDGTRKGSILVHLLPYLEQQSVYDAFNFGVPNIDGQTYPGTAIEIGSTVISTYVCPSDNHPGVFDTPPHSSFDGVTRVALHNYAASRGPNQLADNSACSCTHPYNAVGWGPYESFDNFAGPFTRRCTCVPLAAITDGLSGTIFFGEVRPMCSWHNDNGWATSNNGNGYTSTVIPINYDTCTRDNSTPDNCHRFCNWNTEAGFRSAHPGGASFLFGDGTVHFLPETIDHKTYQMLGGKNEGEPRTIP
jgi:hypothetical protein